MTDRLAYSLVGPHSASEMGRRIDALDWSKTELGPREGWPGVLRQVVEMVLANPLPQVVRWGRWREGDGGGLVQIYNDAYIDIAGSRHPGGLGKGFRECWPEAWERLEGVYERVWRGESVVVEDLSLTLDRGGGDAEVGGTDAYFTAGHSPLRGDDGEVLGVLVTVVETTRRVELERRRARTERELAESLRRLREVTNTLPAIVWLATPDGRVGQLNQRWYEFTGLSVEESEGMGWVGAVHPEDAERCMELREESRRSGGDFEMEMRFLGRDGVYAWHLVRERAERDGQGLVTGWIGTSVDIDAVKRAEREVRESENRFRNMADDAPVMVWVADKVGDATFLSRSWYEFTGQTERTGLGKGWLDAVHPDDREKAERTYLRAVEAEDSFSLEYRLRGKDGAYRWAIDSARPRFGEGGGFLGFIGSVIDITERREAEEKIRESEELLRLGLRAGQTGMWSWDIARNVVTWSEQVYEIHGLKPGEFGGTLEAFAALVIEEDKERVQQSVIASLRDGKLYGVEFRTRRPDGEVRWLATTGEVFMEGGVPVKMMGAVADVTERKRLEASLVESGDRLRMAVAIAKLGTYEIDLKSNVVNITEEGCRILGWDARNELTFDKAREQIHPDDLPGVVEATRRAMNPGGTGEYTEEHRIYRGDGEMRWVRVRGRVEFEEVMVEPGRVERRASRLLGTFLDVTEQKHAEREREMLLEREREARAEAERASEAKSAFLATLSHELRTPLTPVLMGVSVLERHKGLPEELREEVASIRRNVELESQLISDLLDLTRITRGKLQLEPRVVDAHAVVRAAVEVCGRGGEGGTARLELKLDAVRSVVRGDSTRLQQVFWNLVSNAIKFTPQTGRIEVRSRVVGTEGGGGAEEMVCVEVEDTGEGIDSEVMPRLFNAFEQGEARAGRQHAGLGLGLAISKRLVEAHGGRIEAKSPGRGGGSTFAVFLPLAGGGVSGGGIEHQPRREVQTRGARISVLVVEDHAASLRVMMRLLKSVGHEVKGVGTMREAMEAARVERFDVIVSDLGLPDGSGLELMRALREDYGGRAIAVSGYGMETDLRESLEAGFVEHLVKPVDMEMLEGAIERVVAGISEACGGTGLG